MVGTATSEDMLVFYSGSSVTALPGKGTHEKAVDKSVYRLLPRDFRIMFSNLYVSPFELDGHVWASVEHYYHASKYSRRYPEFAAVFTMDTYPDNPISENTRLALSAGGKSGKISAPKLRELGYGDATPRGVPGFRSNRNSDWQFERPEDYVYDQGFETESAGLARHPEWTHQDIAFLKSMYAKFSQNPTLRQALLNTHDAQLWHLEKKRGKPSKLVHFWFLEVVRSALRARSDIEY